MILELFRKVWYCGFFHDFRTRKCGIVVSFMILELSRKCGIVAFS